MTLPAPSNRRMVAYTVGVTGFCPPSVEEHRSIGNDVNVAPPDGDRPDGMLGAVLVENTPAVDHADQMSSVACPRIWTP